MSPKFNPTKLAAFLLIILNFLIFFKINTVPILWQQGERTYHALYWSADDHQGYTFELRSGLRPKDFLKITSTNNFDVLFRTRQFSILAGMLSSKFWQSLQQVTFRDYTLIGLHLFNVILVFFCVKLMTNSPPGAILSALLALNSGTAHATLLFPFLLAKILVTTLFLLCWLCLIPRQGEKEGSQQWRGTAFFVLLFLAVFTDETIVFLFLILLLYFIIIKKPAKKEIMIFILKGLLTLSLCVLVAKTLFIIDARLNNGITTSQAPHLFQRIGNLYKTTHFLHDTFYAFTAYFLRRNLGYWDWSFWGVCAALASAGMLYHILVTKHSSTTRFLSLVILLVVLLKAILLPHFGVHPYIMPAGTTFPTTLFFSYYYTYSDMILFCISLGLFFCQVVTKNQRNFLILLFLISMINTSHLFHFKEGIADTLAYHGDYPSHQKAIPHILTIKEKLKIAGGAPIYLSFPSGSEPLFSRKLIGASIWERDPEAYAQQLSPEFINYASIVPVQYLVSFEQGKLIISLRNVQREAPGTDQEFEKAGYFYDVPQEKFVNLSPIKAEYESLMTPTVIQGIALTKTFTWAGAPEGKKHITFFVKGAAEITLHGRTKTLKLRQRYGQSYQMFNFPLDQWENKGNVELTVSPIAKSVSIVGPFLTK